VQEITRLVGPLRRYSQTLLVLIGLLLPTTVVAAQQAPETQIESPAAESGAEGAGESWGENEKPQNYVASKGPSEEGRSYNWVQMGYAGIVMLAMVGFMIWLIKRTPRKSRGPAKPHSPDAP
jgi:hypothetical protein